eukprot:scaffold148721_cov28-Tisochrysis_lutea.AAC.7
MDMAALFEPVGSKKPKSLRVQGTHRGQTNNKKPLKILGYTPTTLVISPYLSRHRPSRPFIPPSCRSRGFSEVNP